MDASLPHNLAEQGGLRARVSRVAAPTRSSAQRSGERTQSIDGGRLDRGRRPAYVLVTSARDEADFIEETIKSVVAQTDPPLRWVIVSDGSTDGTDEIVSKYAEQHGWIQLITLTNQHKRTFAAKARAFNLGWESTKGLGYDAIANVDADVSFNPDYFAFLLDQLASDASLGVVGTGFKDQSLSYDYRFVSLEHVAGPCQLFRRKCLEDIRGYALSEFGGIDVVALLAARKNGWRTRTFPEMSYVHLREMGTAQGGALAARSRDGEKDYRLGSHPLWELFRVVYQCLKKPYLVGGLALMTGYVSSAIGCSERVVTPELMALRRHEQLERLRVILGERIRAVSSLGSHVGRR